MSSKANSSKNLNPFIIPQNLEWVVFLFLYVGITLLFFPNFLNRVYVELGDDWCQFYSSLHYFKRTVQSGILPMWNPLVLCGMPISLDAFSTFTLSHLLVLFLEVDQTWNARVFLTCALSGWLLFLFLRNAVNLTTVAAFVGGFIYLTFSLDIVAERVPYFIPLMFLLGHAWIKHDKPICGFLLSLTVAWYYLSSNPQFVLYSSFMVYLYLMVLETREKSKNVFVSMFKLAMPFILALGLCAFHIFRVYELLGDSNRRLNVEHHVSWLFPTSLIEMIYPKFLLTSVAQELNFIPSVIMRGVMSALSSSEGIRFLEAPYVGIIPLFLAIFVCFKKGKSSFETYSVYFFLGILIYALLNPLIHMVLQFVPILKDLPHVERIFLMYEFALAALAALGFELVWNGLKGQERVAEKMQIVFSWTWKLALILIAGKLILWGVLTLLEQPIYKVLTDTVLPMVLKQSFYQASEEFYAGRIMQLMEFFKAWFSPNNTYFLYPSVILVCALVWFKKMLGEKAQGKSMLVVLCLLLFADAWFHLNTRQSYESEQLAPLHKEADFIKQHEGLFRTMPLQPYWDEDAPPLIDERTLNTQNVILRPETNLIYDIATTEGYRALLPLRYVEFIELLSGQAPKAASAGEFENADESMADFMNLRFFITPKDRELGDGYKLVYEGDRYRIFENKDFFNRAFLVHRMRVVRESKDVLETLRDGRVDLAKEVIVEHGEMKEGLQDVGTEGMSDRVRLKTYAPHHVIYNVQNLKEAIFVMSDSYYPGWKVWVNGEQTELLRANYHFRAVQIPAGTNTLEFRYEPESFVRGLRVSGVFLLVLALIYIVFPLVRKPAKA